MSNDRNRQNTLSHNFLELLKPTDEANVQLALTIAQGFQKQTVNNDLN